MPLLRWICLVALFVLAGGIAPAQAAKKGKQNPAQVRENAKEEAIDQLAERVFNQADGNHNHVLSRTESATADELLQSGIASLAEQGILGMPANNKKGQGKKGKKQIQAQAPNGAAVFGPPPSTETKKGKGTSLSEFKAYAHTVAQQADAELAQARATQMQARGGKGRGRRMQNVQQQQPAP